MFATCYAMEYVNLSRVYHYVRGQEMLKLYVVVGMMEVFDRLFCSLGQDLMDTLYWTARFKPQKGALITKTVLVSVYVLIHTLLLFVHLVTLMVAINSKNTGFNW